MAKAKPGRFRWSFFFPFPGTLAHQASVSVEKIDHNKMAHLENFTEGSCLDFGEKQNLFLKKAGRLFPWFVNAASDLPVAEFYKKKVEEILALDAVSWEKRADEFYNQDKEISQHFVDKGLSHYAIKYNPFMGVISDYFTVEE
jgi:anaerobic magnesium-protoporphyrin IX monomethyl ester cyclase